jgi:cytochrome c biogenesis protein CcdA
MLSASACVWEVMGLNIEIPLILTTVFYGCVYCLQGISSTVTQNRPWVLPYVSMPIYYLLIILVDAVWSDVLIVSAKNPLMNKWINK